MATFTTRADYFQPNKYFEPTQPNPTEKLGHGKKGDCVIRAFSLAANIGWLEAFDILVAHARKTYSVPNCHTNYIPLFQELGYERIVCKAVKGKKRMTAEDFCRKHRKGRYILRLSNHLSAVVDGKIRDSWNPANKCVYSYFIISEQ